MHYMVSSEILSIIGPALLAGLIITVTHAPLGIEVLKRGIIFIDLAIEMYRENNADSVISGKKVDFPVEWLLSVDPKTKQISGADLAKISGKNRQSFEQQFIPNGGIYVLKHHLVKAQKSYYFNKTLFYEMPEERSIDIDVGYDFKLAEFFLEQMQSENL